MNTGLRRLIDEYRSAVASLVSHFDASGIPRPPSNKDWAFSGIEQRGRLDNGVEYFKHGYGISFRAEGRVVDFDFGDRGEIDGIDIWKVASFARESLAEYGFASESQLKAAFEAAVQAGEFHRRGDLYYPGAHAA